MKKFKQNKNLTFHEKQNLYEDKLWFKEKKYNFNDIGKTFYFILKMRFKSNRI